eukprot:3203639-Alexandrium_andersonii.AAC.1
MVKTEVAAAPTATTAAAATAATASDDGFDLSDPRFERLALLAENFGGMPLEDLAQVIASTPALLATFGPTAADAAAWLRLVVDSIRGEDLLDGEADDTQALDTTTAQDNVCVCVCVQTPL